MLQQVHEATLEAGAYPSPLNYFSFPKSVCTSVNEVHIPPPLSPPPPPRLSSPCCIFKGSCLSLSGIEQICTWIFTPSIVQPGNCILSVLHSAAEAAQECNQRQPVHAMRFGSTAKALAECRLKYYRISECFQCFYLILARFGSEEPQWASSFLWPSEEKFKPDQGDFSPYRLRGAQSWDSMALL